MTWQDIAAVLNAESTLEQTLYEVAPCTEDDDGQSESRPFVGVETQVTCLTTNRRGRHPYRLSRGTRKQRVESDRYI